jgi:hypothetical protein
MKQKEKRNYTIIVNGKRYESSHIRRFLNHVRTIKWEIGHPRVYLRVSYGMKENHQGKRKTFYNDGSYTEKHEFNQALKAFLE